MKGMDVKWYFPKHKRAIAHSTKATSDLLAVLSEMTENHTPLEILPLITYDVEAKSIMKTYIDNGYGNIPLVIR